MDLWALLLKRLGIPSFNFAFLGRWIGHLPHGQWTHKDITKAAPIKGELWMGWFAHYSIGVTFAALLLAVYGLEWARRPTSLPALAIAIVTVVAPLFILQPALGAGIAFSRTPKQVFNSIKNPTPSSRNSMKALLRTWWTRRHRTEPAASGLALEINGLWFPARALAADRRLPAAAIY
jgi:hypothetical protein